MKVSTGFPELDRVLDGGLEGGKLYFIAGGPGVGKTILATRIASNVASVIGSNHVDYVSSTEDQVQHDERFNALGLTVKMEHHYGGLMNIVHELDEKRRGLVVLDDFHEDRRLAAEAQSLAERDNAVIIVGQPEISRMKGDYLLMFSKHPRPEDRTIEVTRRLTIKPPQ